MFYCSKAFLSIVLGTTKSRTKQNKLMSTFLCTKFLPDFMYGVLCAFVSSCSSLLKTQKESRKRRSVGAAAATSEARTRSRDSKKSRIINKGLHSNENMEEMTLQQTNRFESTCTIVSSFYILMCRLTWVGITHACLAIFATHGSALLRPVHLPYIISCACLYDIVMSCMYCHSIPIYASISIHAHHSPVA